MTIPGNIGLVQILIDCTVGNYMWKGTQRLVISMKSSQSSGQKSCDDLLRLSLFSTYQNDTVWLEPQESLTSLFQFMLD